MEGIAGLLAVFLLVFMNGFFVAAEFSLVGARQTRLAQLAGEGHSGAKVAQEAVQHIDSYIAATQLGITLASLALGWIGEPAVAHLIEPLLRLLPLEDIAPALDQTIAVVVAFSLVTVFHIVLGELVPKSIALQRPEGTAIIVSGPTTWFLRLFWPIIRLMNGVGNAIVKLIGFQPTSGHEQVHSAEELVMLVHYSQEAGLIPESDERLLRRAFDFSDILVAEVMKPRVNVLAFPVDIPFPALLEQVVTQHYSRYPVYEGVIDNVVGILHTKDLLDTVAHQPELLTNGGQGFDLLPLLHPPLFVPATVHVDKLLEQMQKTKTHVAIIIDEYGGMSGAATMEDVFEELVGEVQDEFDSEGKPFVTQADIMVVDGLVSLTEIGDRFGELEKEPESTTIGGYVAEQLGRIPQLGDCVRYADYSVCVRAMEGMRVSKVEFSKVGA
ncbi:MAG: hemolysin family protein [Anaerolineae bacterium]|nr:hemolysin family protein [Anaerolineae bacterium]